MGFVKMYLLSLFLQTLNPGYTCQKEEGNKEPLLKVEWLQELKVFHTFMKKVLEHGLIL